MVNHCGDTNATAPLVRKPVTVGPWTMVGWCHDAASPSGALPAPVVCANGAGVSSRELLPLVRTLGWGAYTVDLPGIGASAAPERPLSLPEAAEALVGWVTAMNLAPACLLGSSYGCQVAVEAAVRFPAAVSSLVLAGPTMDPRARTWPRAIARWVVNTPGESPAQAPLLAADYRDAGPRTVVATFREALNDRVEDKLPRVAAPALVLRGARDRMVPQAWAEEVTRLLPAGRLRVLPRAAHLAPFQSPESVARAVRDFLAGDTS